VLYSIQFIIDYTVVLYFIHSLFSTIKYSFVLYLTQLVYNVQVSLWISIIIISAVSVC